MQRIIIIFIIVSINSFLIAQQLDSLDVRLMQLEYSIFLQKNDSAKKSLKYQKINLCILNQNYHRAYEEIQKVIDSQEKDTLIRRWLLWDKTLLAYLNDDVFQAYQNYNNYINYTKDSSISSLIMGWLIYQDLEFEDSNMFEMAILKRDSSFQKIFSLKRHKENDSKYKLAKISSWILPGMGMFILGYPIKGINAFIINAAWEVGIIVLIQHQLFFNAVFLGITWGVQKFYMGNVRLTKKIIRYKQSQNIQDIRKHQHTVLKDVLIKYPLALNLLQK